MMLSRRFSSKVPSFKLSRSILKPYNAISIPSRKMHNLGNIDDVSKFPSDQYKKVMREGPINDSRTFSYVVLGTAYSGVATFGTHCVLPLLDSMNPSASTIAAANIEVDLSKINEGECITFKYRGKPLFVRHRTPGEIHSANSVPLTALPDPQLDSDRVKDPRYIILLGICTHLGCVPLNGQGNYGGWFCPCHGSHYDTSGRIRSGPAPTNLEIPPYYFINDSKIFVGLDSDPAAV